jgi:type I restriction enzyme R subunit
MSFFDIVAASNESTVFAEYTPEKRKSTDYQSEAELEKDLIRRLTLQGYEYISIKSENELIEWEHFYSSVIVNRNDGILEKTRKI